MQGAIASTIVPWRDLRINRAKEEQMPEQFFLLFRF